MPVVTAGNQPTVGTCSYNGVTFGSYSDSEVRVTPVYDEAGRTVIYAAFLLNINGFLAGDTNADMAEVQQRLLTPGQQLRYEGKGFGTFLINVDGRQDAAWGPKPELLTFQPLGAQGAKISWRVTGRMPVCSNAKFTKHLAAVNFDAIWDINEKGLTHRTCSGYLEIPLTRVQGGRIIADSADSYFEKVVPDVPPGFKRKSWRHLSKDRRRLDFRFTDEELEVPLPPGATAWTAEHVVNSDLESNFQNWKCSMNASVTMTKNASKAAAFDRFMLFVRSRLGGKNDKDDGKRAEAAAAFGKMMAGKIGVEEGRQILNRLQAEPINAPVNVLIQSLTIREEVSTLTTHFALTYRILGVAIERILNASGLWKPVDGLDFNLWKTSMASVFSPRGIAGHRFDPNDDAIVDLCLTGSAPALLHAGVGGAELRTGNSAGKAFAKQRAPKDKTWVKYENTLQVLVDHHIVRHKPLTGAAGTRPVLVAPNADGTVKEINGLDYKGRPGHVAVVSDFLQRVTAPSVRIRMFGRGVRVGQRVPAPKLVKVGGQPVEENYVDTKEHEPAGVMGVFIYQTTWDYLYLMKTLPRDRTLILANPVMDIDGGDK